MATYNGQVTGGGLNLRASASTSSSKLTQIPNNTQIVVSDYSGNSSWYCTTYGSYSGFVLKQYVNILSNVASQSATVTGGGLNLRSYPSTSASSPVQIPNNTSITVQTHNSTWSSTTYNGHSGFVMTKYLTIGGSTGGGSTGGTLSFGAEFLGCTSNFERLFVRNEPDSNTNYVNFLEGVHSFTFTTFTGGPWTTTQQQEWLKYTGAEGGYSGYVLAKFVCLWDSDDANASISGSGVNFRTGPSTNDSVITVLQKDERLLILSAKGNWYRVCCSKGTGWVSSSYVTRD